MIHISKFEMKIYKKTSIFTSTQTCPIQILLFALSWYYSNQMFSRGRY